MTQKNLKMQGSYINTFFKCHEGQHLQLQL